MNWKTETLESPTGARLRLYTAHSDQPKAIVQINHGMAEHAARYQRFANALTDAGYAVFAHDHRGHGHTSAPDAAQGFFAKEDGLEKVLADVDAVNSAIRTRYPDQSVVCFGHSMGAMIALNFAIRHPEKIDAVAVWNISVDAGALLAAYMAILKTERFFKGSDVPSRIAPKLTFEAWNKEFTPTRTDFDWLSRDEAEVNKYIADPLCGFDATIGMWLNIAEGVAVAANDKGLADLPKLLPVHLLAGKMDPVSLHGKAMSALEKRMRGAGMSDVALTLLDGTRHESLNEINREKTTADFIDWLDKRFS